MYVKKELRKKLKAKRQMLHNADTDSIICNNLLSFEPYINAGTVLFFAPLADEINIDSVIDNALSVGKRVALPVCCDEKGNMQFYYIKSLDDLKSGYFGVREPDVATCDKCTDFNDAICIVPAIAYDKQGCRLGYGKGYYDRFLKNFYSLSVGLCYNELIEDKLPTDEYDIPVDYIITQTGAMRVITKEDNNG